MSGVPPDPVNERVALLHLLFKTERHRELILVYLNHWLEHGKPWGNSGLKVRIAFRDKLQRQELAGLCGRLMAAMVFAEVHCRFPRFMFAVIDDGLVFGDSQLPPDGCYVVEADAEALRKMAARQKHRPDSSGQGTGPLSR